MECKRASSLVEYLMSMRYIIYSILDYRVLVSTNDFYHQNFVKIY